MNITPADAMLFVVFAASLAILLYTKFDKKKKTT